MEKITLIVLLLISMKSFGQENEFDKFLMVKVSKLAIRAEPKLESKQLMQVDKEELVKIVDRRTGDKYLSIVDGILDTWAEVEYKGTKGFMFGGYLTSEEISMPNGNWTGKYLLALEGNQGGLMYSAELNWYGIYPRSDGEYLERVELKLEYSLDEEMGDNLKVSTNKNEFARIIIGTNEQLQTGRVGIPLGWHTDRVIMSDQVLMIPVFEDNCSVNTDFRLIASNWNNKVNSCYVEKYNLNYYLRPLNQPTMDLKEFEGLIENLSGCNIPKLYWYGDLNGDNIPDFIFINQATYYGKYKLYLSKKENGNIKLEKKVEFIPIFTPC